MGATDSLEHSRRAMRLLGLLRGQARVPADQSELVLLLQHGLGAWAFQCLAAGGDYWCRSLLEEAYSHTIARGLWMEQQQKRYRSLLQGYSLCELKGRGLAKKLYGAEAELRWVSDWDLYLAPDSGWALWQQLRSVGFRPQPLGPSPVHQQQARWFSTHWPPLRKAGFSVEIHHRLWDKPGYVLEPWQPPVYQGGELPRLPPYREFLFLFDHFFAHLERGQVQLKWLQDLYFYQLRQPEAVDEAQKHMPAHLQAHWGRWQSWLQAIEGRVGPDEHLLDVVLNLGKGHSHKLRRWWQRWWQLPGLEPKAARMWADLVPPPEYMRHYYGPQGSLLRWHWRRLGKALRS